MSLCVFLELRYFLLAATIVIYDNLPVLAFSTSLSPLVMIMPRQIFLSDVIPHEEGVIGALEFS